MLFLLPFIDSFRFRIEGGKTMNFYTSRISKDVDSMFCHRKLLWMDETRRRKTRFGSQNDAVQKTAEIQKGKL